jgi:MFS family permease
VFALVRTNPAFRQLFLAHATSRAGDAFNTVALVVLVFQLTGSGLGVATTVVFEVVPIVMLGPIAGVLADRFPRRRLMIIADLARAVLVTSLVITHSWVGLAFAVAFGLSVGSLVFNPAASSLVPDVVDDADIVNANTALWTVAVAAQVVLAPLAGVIIATAGVGPAFAVNAASYVGSALLLTRLDAGKSPASTVILGWPGVRQGIDTVRSNPLLARLAVVQVLASLSAGATSGLLVLLASERLHVGPSGFGFLVAAIGVGAAAGPLVLRRWIKPSDKRWLFGPYAARGAVDLTLAAVSQPLAAGAALGVYGVGTSTGMIAYQSTLQTTVPPEVRGRAFALYDVLWNATRLISLGLGGLLADAVSVQAVYLVGGLLLLASGAVGLTTTIPSSDA